MWEMVVYGASVAFQPENVMFALFGSVLGVLFGATPGISATLGIALLVPLTFDMSATSALIFLGAVYCGAIYGGSISGILLNVPGTPAAVASMIDGHEMTRKGQAGKALGTAVVASLIGGQVSVVVLLFAAPLVAALSLHIRSAEFFWIVVFAMSTIGALGAGSVLKGLIAGVIGLIIGTVGMHPFTGTLRYTFGMPALYEGVPVIVSLVGLFSISQVLLLTEGKGSETQLKIPRIGPLWPGWRPLWEVRATLIRSPIIGTFVGILPGAGADIAAFIARNEAERFSKKPEEFGKGSMEGVAGAEAANNAVVGGSLIPMLTLGIPGNAVTAALLGGLLIHGLIPSPRLFQEQGQVLYPFIFSLFLANALFTIVAFIGLRHLAKVALVPQGILAPVVATLAVIGAFSFRNSVVDIWIMMILGLIGYVLRKTGFPLAPIILGIILGPLAEENLERVMTIASAQGNGLMEHFMSRGVTVVFMVLSILALVYSVWREVRRKPVEGPVEEAE